MTLYPMKLLPGPLHTAFLPSFMPKAANIYGSKLSFMPVQDRVSKSQLIAGTPSANIVKEHCKQPCLYTMDQPKMVVD